PRTYFRPGRPSEWILRWASSGAGSYRGSCSGDEDPHEPFEVRRSRRPGGSWFAVRAVRGRVVGECICSFGGRTEADWSVGGAGM
ncbi:MAG: hypothetical protein FWD57_16105, partial [Polyangiaceae bacterium]|nr:hypothetical protein [Polyangiaceae bacterium]